MCEELCWLDRAEAGQIGRNVLAYRQEGAARKGRGRHLQAVAPRAIRELGLAEPLGPEREGIGGGAWRRADQATE
jgi:hypothetical protein